MTAHTSKNRRTDNQQTEEISHARLVDMSCKLHDTWHKTNFLHPSCQLWVRQLSSSVRPDQVSARQVSAVHLPIPSHQETSAVLGDPVD